jgi:mannose PTS system EIIA component
MIGVVICTHARLGDSLIDAAKMILGDFQSSTSISVMPGESGEDIVDKLTGAIAQVESGSGVIILCDMFGGTPSNVSLTLLSDKIEVVTGVNLPMLLKLSTCRTRPLSAVAEMIQSHGRDNILVAGALLRSSGDAT